MVMQKEENFLLKTHCNELFGFMWFTEGVNLEQ